MRTPIRRIAGIAAAVALIGATSLASSQVSIGGQGPGGRLNMDELLSGLQGPAAKPMEIGTGVIVGRVFDESAGSGIGGAIVSLTLAGFTPARVQADGEGRFAFRALPKGTFSISTNRPGYVDGAAGRTRPGGAARGVTLSDEVRSEEVEIPMWRYAAIAGTVLDENNEPLVGAQIRILRRDFVAGRRQLTLGATDTTDDRGQYRIGSLEAGDYIVALPITHRPSLDSLLGGLRDGAGLSGGGGGGGAVVSMRAEVATRAAGGAPIVISNLDGTAPPAGTNEDGAPLTYQTEYYTGALAASRATPITLTHGEERTGIDFKLVPVRALSISGIVTGPDGPTENVQLQLVPADAGDVTSPIEVATTSSDGNGHFTFEMVPAGQYQLKAIRQPRAAGQPMTFTQSSGDRTMVFRSIVETASNSAPLPDQPTLWAETPVGVGTRALAELNVALRPGLTVSGNVGFIGQATQPTPEQRAGITLSLEPADGRTAAHTGIVRGRVDASGTFTTMGVPAGKYVLRVSGIPQGWTLRDATFNGRDITSRAVELESENANGVVLTFTDRPTEVNGTVRDASGNPDVRATVLVFPADPAAWTDTGAQPRRLRQVRAGQDGSFKVQGLPAGDYNIVAVDDSTLKNWQDPAFLAQAARGASELRLMDGDTKTQALTTRGGR